MIGELRNQNVFRLLGTDDVEVELLIDVRSGLRAFSKTQKY